jgi:WD40 repeat protein/predicted SprT family Zn-dependent metalloprotease
MRHKILLHITSLIVLCFVLFFPSQAQQGDCLPPVSLPAATEPNIFTPEQEVFLGEAVAEQIQKDYRVIEDTKLTGYLTRIGEQLNAHLPLSKMRFQFFLVDLPDANAFVLPGGRIYVSRKLVSLAESADELAGVIAHELGHLVAHESAIDITRRFKEVLGVTEVTDRQDIFEKYNRLIDNVRRKPEAFKPRDRERGQMVADQAGLYALIKAGYDPAALARFWDRMTETKGKTGNWFTDVFGSTKPEQRRLREMLKAVASLPSACVAARTSAQDDEFKSWQSSVISYAFTGRLESLHGVLAKQQLSPPLRSNITHLRFSPDGKYVLAQDDSGINILTRDPFKTLFRIEAANAYPANFTPDSQEIVFYTDNLRVERWSVTEEKVADVKEVVVLGGCLQTKLSPDGKVLACLTSKFDLSLLDVATGKTVIQKKEFYSPSRFDYLRLILALMNRVDDSGDLELDLVNMGFSFDGRYFTAGFYGTPSYGGIGMTDRAEAYDLTTLAKVSLPDSVKTMIGGGFTFVGNDRIAGINHSDRKKSGLMEFPSGKMVSEFPLYRKDMLAPTQGSYLLLRPFQEHALGVMNLDTGIIFKTNEQPALDIYGDVFVAEMRNGQIGLYKMEKNVLMGTALLSNFTLGGLLVAELSSDMKWLALSSRSRGGVWNMEKGEAALYLRGYRGGFLSDDGYFYGDFPKYETAERNVAKFNLATGDVTPGSTIETDHSRQIGPYLVVTKSGKPNLKEGELIPPYQYRKNTTLELLDARTMVSLWSKTYPKESPNVWVSPSNGTATLVWDVTDEAAKAEIKSDAKLTQQLAAMKEKEGDYLLEILDVRNGDLLGKLLIETGKGSFRLSNVFAAGDWVVITDTRNRVQVYSLKTGELKGRVFGGFATVSPATNLLCVENEKGRLALYNLETMEKRDQFGFPSAVSLIRFNPDGRRLFVLTTNQIAYTLDVSQTPNTPAASKD